MILNLLKSIKYLCPLFAVFIAIMAICGAFFSPPTWAEPVLHNYDYSFKVLVGFESQTRSSGQEEHQNSSRSYILFPSLKTVTISLQSHKNQSEEVIAKVTSEESKVASFETFLMYIALLFGTWWYWIRPVSKQKNDKQVSA